MSAEYTEGSSRSETKPRSIDRSAFLRLSGAGLAGVVLFGSLGSAGVSAQTPPEPPTKVPLAAEFKRAAEEHGIPVELLMAMGWVNTRWEMPPPETNDYERGDLHGWGSYGIMALVQNPFSDTLGEASRLTGIPQEVLKTNRAANIRGGAALLASSAVGYASGEPSDYFGAVVGRGLGAGKSYIAVAGIGGGELYAEQVFGTLQTGASKRMSSGEMISLPFRTPNSGIQNIHGW